MRLFKCVNFTSEQFTHILYNYIPVCTKGFLYDYLEHLTNNVLELWCFDGRGFTIIHVANNDDDTKSLVVDAIEGRGLLNNEIIEIFRDLGRRENCEFIECTPLNKVVTRKLTSLGFYKIGAENGSRYRTRTGR